MEIQMSVQGYATAIKTLAFFWELVQIKHVTCRAAPTNGLEALVFAAR